MIYFWGLSKCGSKSPTRNICSLSVGHPRPSPILEWENPEIKNKTASYISITYLKSATKSHMKCPICRFICSNNIFFRLDQPMCICRPKRAFQDTDYFCGCSAAAVTSPILLCRRWDISAILCVALSLIHQ